MPYVIHMCSRSSSTGSPVCEKRGVWSQQPPHHHPNAILAVSPVSSTATGISSPQSCGLHKSAHLSKFTPALFFADLMPPKEPFLYWAASSNSWQESWSASHCCYVPARSSNPLWPLLMKDIFVVRIQCWQLFLLGRRVCYSVSPGVHYFCERVGNKSSRYC